MIAGLLGVLVVTIAVFSNALLPGDVRIHRVMPRRWLPVVALLGAAAGLGRLRASRSSTSSAPISTSTSANVPLLGGSGSAIVIFFVVLPVALCLIGAIIGFFRSRPSHGAVVLGCLRRPRPRRGGHDRRLASGRSPPPPRDTQAHVASDRRRERLQRRHPGRGPGGLRRNARRCHSALVECPPLGKSRALNVGLAHAEADIIVRIDADTLVTPELLVKVVPHFWDARWAASACCRFRANSGAGSPTCARSRPTTAPPSSARLRTSPTA